MAAQTAMSEKDEKFEPLLIFYDSEAANGNVSYGDVIEIAATCHPGVVVGSFESLVDSEQELCLFGELASTVHLFLLCASECVYVLGSDNLTQNVRRLPHSVFSNNLKRLFSRESFQS